MREINYGYSV